MECKRLKARNLFELFRKNVNDRGCARESGCCGKRNEEEEKTWNVSER